MSPRTATVTRESKETQITLTIDLDTPGNVVIDTTVPFLTHMLNTLATHGRMSLQVHARGDIEVDPHHLIEDTGIVLGQAIFKALGGFNGIHRAGCFSFPMDGTLANVALDLCGRPNLLWNVTLEPHLIGPLDPSLFKEFYKALADSLRFTLHVNTPYVDNNHHVIEAIFKAFARALRQAIQPLDADIPLSTKGSFD